MENKSEELIASTYRHDLANPYGVMEVSLDDSEPDVIGFEELSEEEQAEFEEFVGLVWATIDRLDAGRELDFIQKEVEILSEYESDISGKPGEYIEDVKELSQLFHSYICDSGQACNKVDGGLLLDSLAGTLENNGADVSYNDIDDSEAAVYGDEGLCMAANTIGANWEMHGREDEESQLWAEVEELEDAYRIGIWDDGPGLPDGYDGENIFKKGNGENTGLGLYLAREITELFDGSLEYSEEYASREDGFGLEWTLMKPDQYSTSESL